MKYIFFDFNGTILDDLDLCLRLLNDILRKQNKNEITLDEYKNIFCFPIKSYYEKAGIDFNLNSFEELSKYFIDNYQEASFKCHIHNHLLEVVRSLKAKGYVVGVLSASQIDNLKEQLKELELIDEFDFILGIKNIYAHSKVDLALDFIKDNNLESADLYLIGDTDHDYLVASKINAKCLLISNGHQSAEVLKKVTDNVSDNLLDVLSFVS